MSKLSYFVFLALLAMPAMAAPPNGAGIVRELYKDFAWEAVVADNAMSNEILIEQPRAILRKYFASKLASLILADRDCVSTNHGICALDFSPIWASQDPAAVDLSIEPDRDPHLVTVHYTYPSNGEKIVLRYKMVFTASGWRISDIVYQSGPSLITILSGNGK
jgi:hypothetical protein